MPEKNLNWKEYEFITKYIYEALGKEHGVKVEGYGNTCKVEGKSGVKHQIDVLTSHYEGKHTYKTAIECKYLGKKINKDTVMKLAVIIEDADIHKGIIVSKKGFTKDAMAIAIAKNIGLVELREFEEQDQKATTREFDVAYLDILVSTSLTRPEIININLEYLDAPQNEQEQINIYAHIIRLPNGNLISFTDYTKAFQDELHHQNLLFKPITKRYDVSGALINKLTNTTKEIKGVTFTGVLKKIDSNHNLKFTIVDKVWLIMKSIFEGKIFRVSENGIIVKDK
jgi:hypothetical protein